MHVCMHVCVYVMCVGYVQSACFGGRTDVLGAAFLVATLASGKVHPSLPGEISSCGIIVLSFFDRIEFSCKLFPLFLIYKNASLKKQQKLLLHISIFHYCIFHTSRKHANTK